MGNENDTHLESTIVSSESEQASDETLPSTAEIVENFQPEEPEVKLVKNFCFSHMFET